MNVFGMLALLGVSCVVAMDSVADISAIGDGNNDFVAISLSRRMKPSPQPVSLTQVTKVAQSSLANLKQVKSGLNTNIKLRDLSEMQFYGNIYVGRGKSRQVMTVCFDTGSGQFVLSGKGCGQCMGKRRYDFTKAVKTIGKQTIVYGSGKVTGTQVEDVVWLSDKIKAPAVTLLAATAEAPAFHNFFFDGVIGLDLTIEQGETMDFFQQMIKANPKMKPVFAFYLTPKGGQTGSEISIGGYNAKKIAAGASFVVAKVIPYPFNVYNYWTVEMGTLNVGNAKTNVCTGGCKTIIDSGTTFIDVGKSTYPKLMQAIINTPKLKGKCKNTGIAYTCSNTQHKDFPTLYITFKPGKTALPLEGKAYVACTLLGCSISLRASTSELWILGDFFMRKYYTIFDRKSKQVTFACAVNMCKDSGPKTVIPKAAPSRLSRGDDSREATERLLQYAGGGQLSVHNGVFEVQAAGCLAAAAIVFGLALLALKRTRYSPIY